MVLSVQDKILRNTVNVDGFANGISREMIRVLRESRLELLDRIAATKGPFTRAFKQNVLAEVDSTLLQLNQKYNGIVLDGQRHVVQLEFESVKRALLSELKQPLAVEFRLPIGRMDAILKKPIMGKPLDEWFSKHFNGMRRGIRRELAKSLAQGEGIPAARRRLMKGFEATRNQADVIARTALLESSKRARDEVYRGAANDIMAYEYVSVLDSRICMECAPDDGKREKKRQDLPQPLRHPRCRCSIVPVTEFSDEDPGTRPAVIEYEGKEGEKHTGHLVRSREKDEDGKPVSTHRKFTPAKVQQVSAKTTYDQFFRRQDAGFQRQVLGPGRYQNWLDEGKPPLDRYRNRLGRVLTVKELRMEAAA